METRRVQVVCELDTKNIRDMDAMINELKSIPHCCAVEGDEITFEYCGFEHGMKTLSDDKMIAMTIVDSFTVDLWESLCGSCIFDITKCNGTPSYDNKGNVTSCKTFTEKP